MSRRDDRRGAARKRRILDRVAALHRAGQPQPAEPESVEPEPEPQPEPEPEPEARAAPASGVEDATSRVER